MQNSKKFSLPGLAYAASPLDRRVGLRLKLTEDAANLSAYLVMAQDRVFLEGEKVKYFQGDAPFALKPTRVFLGMLGSGEPLFAAESEAAMPDWPDLRGLAASGRISSQDLSILAQARGLLSWHARHGFCANCGSATQLADFGGKRQCSACGAEHFPRTDPVVILTVTHQNRILLGRGLQFPENLYSALAGFMEPGETIEQAGARELREETGIRAQNLRYLASQPWPFPSSLMIGLTGTAENDEIIIDPNELADARWFSKREVEGILSGENTQFLMPKQHAIAYHLLKYTLHML